MAGKVIIPYASPVKLFEYMAAGRAVVASNVGAIPEVLRDGENALLVAPGSAAELVAAITRVLEDRALSRRLGAAARRDVQSYSWEARVARVLDFARGDARAAAAV